MSESNWVHINMGAARMLANGLKSERVESNYAAPYVAKACHIAPERLEDIEEGRVFPTFEEVKALCEVMKFDPYYTGWLHLKHSEALEDREYAADNGHESLTPPDAVAKEEAP